VSEFAEFATRPADAAPAVGVEVGLGAVSDLDGIASIHAGREGVELDVARARIRRELEAMDPVRRLFVAHLEGEVVGYGRVARLECRTLPAGWYLTGVVVRPDRRRRGIGRSLTRHRIRWLEQRADRIHYFANSQNRVTIALHEWFGFREIARGVSVPACSFEGGEGVLFVR
jgi:ribosomal protein S18 acetylase RimI-like enzyme